MWPIHLLIVIINLIITCASEYDQTNDIIRIKTHNGLEILPRNITLEDDKLLWDFAKRHNQLPAVSSVLIPEIKYYLSTRNGKFHLKKSNIANAPFVASNSSKTVVVIHGYFEIHTGFLFWVNQLRDKYLAENDWNFIAIDWFSFARLNYLWAAARAKTMGDHIGDMLVTLVDAKKIQAENTHVIGFSLGAHIAGFVGKRFREMTARNLTRITGLDPAGVLFEKFPFHRLVRSRKRLCASDADFVDVIHTNGGALGVTRSVGQVDFYPNCGCGIQPRCSLLTNVICSHLMAPHLFMKTISSQSLIMTGYKCDSWLHFRRQKCMKNEQNEMGEHCKPVPTGDFYLYAN